MTEKKTQFTNYVKQSEVYAHGAVCLNNKTISSEPLLNGISYKLFRESTSIEIRRDSGAFFTGEIPANFIARQLRRNLSNDSVVMDPTCGIGDLLLAHAGLLPMRPTLHHTLLGWGRILIGADVNREFIRLTKARLIMLARFRGKFSSEVKFPDRYFPNIVCSDMNDALDLTRKADGFLFNPPFGIIKRVQSCEWSAGSVNSAAVFLSTLVKHKKKSAQISAILPEVLRCGSRYKGFRQSLIDQNISGSYRSLGRFDRWADVDVFATLISNGDATTLWQNKKPTKSANGVLSDHFDVRVGPVVPHRHDNRGPWRKFVCAKTTPRWSGGFTPKINRRFQGTTFTPPFVVIRRTSSPSDKQRAVGSVVLGNFPVAVENHLLVLKPKDDSVVSCRKLLKILSDDQTTQFLNTAIRCRHLTTGIVCEIPWKEHNA